MKRRPYHPVIGTSPLGRIQEGVNLAMVGLGALMILAWFAGFLPPLQRWFVVGGWYGVAEDAFKGADAAVGFTGLLIVGVCGYMALASIRQRAKAKRMQVGSIPVIGTIVGVRNGRRVKYAQAIRFDVRWQEPHSGVFVTLPSDDVWDLPGPGRLIGQEVRVLTNINDRKEYYIELEPLLAEA